MKPAWLFFSLSLFFLLNFLNLLSDLTGLDAKLSSSMFIFVAIPLDWERKWQPTPVFLLRKSQGQREPGSLQYSSAQFSHSVVSDSLRPHELQHSRPPCPSPTPGVHPNSCPLSRWCHATISSSVVAFSSRPQSFLASGSFQMSLLFTSGGQSTGVSASASVLQWTPRTDLLQDGVVGSPCSPRDSQESSPTPQFKGINSLVLSFLYSSTLISHPYMTTGKTIALTRPTFVGKVVSAF